MPGRESQSAESLGSAEKVESAENIEEPIEEPAGPEEAEEGEVAEGAGLFEPTVEAEPGEAADPADPVEPPPTRDESERAQEARPEFERVTDVLGPLEQIVLAADQQIGSLQDRVDSESSEVSQRIQGRVREAALEQRGRVLQMKQELTGAATQLATRFETMLDILDQAERQLSRQAGEGEPAGMRVTVTERQRVTFSHDVPEPGPPPAKGPPPVVESSFTPEPAKKRGIRGWFRRRKGSEA